MSVYWQFPAGWWVISVIIYGLYITLFLQRKSYQKPKELKNQLVFAIVTLALSFVIELAAVYLSVWAYFPGNWPIILWPMYFGSGLLGYQLLKKLEEIV